MPIDDLFTTADVAAIYHVSTRRVRFLARLRGVGRQIGQRNWLFTQEEVEAMKPGPVGRRPGEHNRQKKEDT